MPERRVKVPMPDGKMVDGVDVPITESVERWTELKLEDGSVLRLKSTALSVSRLEGQYDQDGNPMYAIKGGQMMVLSSAPEHLRKPASSGPKVQ